MDIEDIRNQVEWQANRQVLDQVEEQVRGEVWDQVEDQIGTKGVYWEIYWQTREQFGRGKIRGDNNVKK